MTACVAPRRAHVAQCLHDAERGLESTSIEIAAHQLAAYAWGRVLSVARAYMSSVAVCAIARASGRDAHCSS
eukprot:3606512-Lingulodinium_polyedra.AAC.1